MYLYVELGGTVVDFASSSFQAVLSGSSGPLPPVSFLGLPIVTDNTNTKEGILGISIDYLPLWVITINSQLSYTKEIPVPENLHLSCCTLNSISASVYVVVY